MATMKQLRARLARARAGWTDSGRVVLSTPAAAGAVQGGCYFLLGAVLAGGRILDGSPFALALVGGGGSGINAAAALLGATVGYVELLGLVEGLRYVSAAILTFSVAFAFCDLKLYRRPWTMPLVTAGMNGCTGAIYLAQGGLRGANVLWLGLEVALTALFAYGFRRVLAPPDREGSGERRVGGVMLAGAVLTALARLSLPGGPGLGGVAAAGLVVSCAWQGGAGAGAALGVALGLFLDLSAGLGSGYTVALGAGALAAGLLSGSGRVRAAPAFCLAAVGAALWGWQEPARAGLVWECILGCGLFLALPLSLQRRLGRCLVEEGDGTGPELTGQVLDRLRQTARGFSALCESLRSAFRAPADGGSDPAVICRRAADRVCRGCALQTTCWQRDCQTTLDALNGATRPMLDRGRAEGGDFPSYFSARCVRFGAFLSAVNQELTGHLCRRQYANRLRDSRRAVCGQYHQLARLLEETAEELGREVTADPIRQRRLRQHLALLGLEGECGVFYDGEEHLRLRLTGQAALRLAGEEELAVLSRLMGTPLRVLERGRTLVLVQREPYMAVAGIAARRRQGQTVSGDAGAWFRRPDGRLYMLLCDGMGSGPEARRESGLAVRLLEQFLRAGVGPENALSVVAGALALRGEEEGGFATVDLLELDLFTGRGAIFKLGAAPTYLKSGGTVRRITGSALPPGADRWGGGRPDCARFALEPGDCVLMVSDGVCPPEEDGRVRRELERFDGASPRELACRLLDGSGQEDDRTALVVQLVRREEERG